MSIAKLGEALRHADQRIRLGGQFEIVRRSEFSMLAEVAGGRFDTVARLHVVWGLGQLARTGNVESKGELQRRLSDADMEVRVQATKTCGELTDFDGRLLVPLLADEAPVSLFKQRLVWESTRWTTLWHQSSK